MNIQEIQALIKEFESSILTSLEIEIDNVKVKMTKQGPLSPILSPVQESDIRREEVPSPLIPSHGTGHGCVPVKSPLVGTFYAASTPKGEPFVKVGQKIAKGDTVCIIEAMKLLNEILSPVSGIVERIDVTNGQVVGYDQVLITIHTGEGRGE